MYQAIESMVACRPPASTTLHQFKFESGINGAPLRATPIYSVSTLSWLRSALKRLPSFALDSCSLVTSLSAIKCKPFCLTSINLKSGVETQFVTAGLFEES
jgi:hypothetical protein